MERFKCQEGAMALFFACFILPVLFFLFAIAFDVTAYLTARNKAQIAADEAVLYAQRFLPYASEAEAAIKSYLNRYFSDRVDLEVGVGNGAISVVLKSPVELYFSKLLSLLTVRRTGDTDLPVTVVSRAVSVPLDVFVAIDSGSELAPTPLDSEPWGESSDWPPAQFFSLKYPDSDVGIRKLLSQQCFNPVFSGLKKGAIMLLDYLSASSENSVGFGFFPGKDSPYDVVRKVGAVANGEMRGDLEFPGYVGEYVSSVNCAAVAENELNHLDYRFPLRNSKLPIPSFEPHELPVLTISSGNEFNKDYLPYLSASQAVWIRAAHQRRNANTAEALAMLYSEVLSAQDSFAARGGFSGHAKKLGVILAGDLPTIGSVRFPQL